MEQQIVIDTTPKINGKNTSNYMTEHEVCTIQIKGQKLGLDQIVITHEGSVDGIEDLNVELVRYVKGTVYQRRFHHHSVYGGVENILEEFEKIHQPRV
ncbi:hypothetical protein HYT53_00355 [Candidatus Woesearchaeota archaeon]|nr:hypothetical protein [Candidatus Woesearchaeota archaeon]